MPLIRPARLLRPAPLAALAVLAAGVVLSTCQENQGPRTPAEPAQARPSAATSSVPATLVGAGNIVRCNKASDDDATASLLAGIPGTVFAAGDNAYDKGTLTQYQQCYDPSWGRQKARTQPTPGERDYLTPGASGYFTYFGAAAGDPAKGYYSYDLGAWHIVVLNSGSTSISMAAGSPQEQWLRADLAAHPVRCTLAYWHHPLFDSKDPPNTAVRPVWNALYNAGVDVVVNAHYAFYERFAPQTPGGASDPATGIREFIVGTGGAPSTSLGTVQPNSEVRNSGTAGVLKLTLDDGSYAWEFVPVAGKTFRDSGTGGCHGTPPISVNAGPDLITNPGDAVQLSVSFTDPAGNIPPWTYAITWGDGASSNGTAQASPFTATHVYSALGLDSVRVTVTNTLGVSGSDSLAVRVDTSTAVVWVGAGDIADCTTTGDAQTATLLDNIAGTVFAVGDNAYPNGSTADFTNCYNPTWGRHKARTQPVPGNHEYATANAAGYFGYFGAAAGDPAKGYYSYDLGDWHILAVNGEIDVSASSPQLQWLRADLAANTKLCTLAYWHGPRFVTGSVITSNPTYQTLWDTLYKYGAEVVVNGHKHSYERFAPQNPSAVLDQTYGMREFVVGTGGTGLDGNTTATPIANSEVRNGVTWGVLKLTLHADSYSWQFVPVAGQTFSDAGSGSCHGAPGGVNHPPTAVPGGPYTGTEGTAVSFDGSGSSDPDGDALTYAWSFGDGATGSGARPTHAYADNGTYTVTLTVTDARGAAGAAATTTATIGNVAPTVNAGPNQTITLGSAVTLSATFSDPGVNDAPWTYAIDWGDGSPQTTGSTTSQSSAITATHTYAAAGTNTVRVTVTDKNGGAGSGTLTVTVTTVANRAPTAVAGGPYTGTVGTPVSFDGSGSSDPDGDALTYAWSFGDGSTGTGVRPAHTYANNGTYTVTLTVTDARGAASAPATTTASIAVASTTVTLVGAGTVASCTSTGDSATAAILDAVPGTVFTVGDNVYPSGSLANFQNCYTPSWGRHKARTSPTLGNHEYDTSPTAADYFTYFGAAAGDPTTGYYSYDLGAWHIVALNSLVSMSAGSAQETWLRADLAAHPARCTLAYWHYPRFSSGTTHGSMVGSQPLWQALYDARGEIVLSGHEHNYERFAPQTPTGAADPVNGIREFVVGTGGGASAYPFGTPIANSEVRITGVNGVLKLTLADGSYSWQFIPVAGQTATDSGSGTCH